MILYTWKTFPYTKIRSMVWYRYTRHKCKYPSSIAAFDIETTRIPEIEQSVMYVWQFAIWFPDTGPLVCIGRTWEEYKQFFERVDAELHDNQRLIVFVHNLSFEFQFLRSVHEFTDPDQVFIVRSRKILKASVGHIEYRCSYLQTNMSLDEFTHKYGVEDAKVHGFDYDKIRWPWTPLSNAEKEYIVHDVLGLIEAMYSQMQHDHDTPVTLPYTSTGYVRRDLKDNMKQWSLKALQQMQPPYSVFEMLREAFRGGDCHANRYYTGQILEHVLSVDRSSSYPDVQVNEKFPMGPWTIETRKKDFNFAFNLCKRQQRAFVARIAIFGLRLKQPDWGAPYLSRDKCRRVYCHDEVRALYMYDNGRILYADYLETTITDVDLRIIMREYVFDEIEILDIAHCRYGRLPQPWIDTNIEYYFKKTTLKGVRGEELYYMKSKNKLNAIYGDTVQDPARPREIYQDGEYTTDQSGAAELLEKASRFPYKSYAWGVWTTAHARYHLHELIDSAHHAVDPDTGIEFNGFIYSDTDSVKYLGELQGLDDYNRRRRRISRQNDAAAKDPAGKWHYMGVYEKETGKSGYDEFITLGAKKYAYKEKGKIHLTLAGVGKIAGAEELQDLRNFKEGFTFQKAGGLEAIYNDTDYGWYQVRQPVRGWYRKSRYHRKRVIHGVMHRLWISRNVTLRPSTYTLGVAGDYKRILEDPQIYLEIFDKPYYN